MTDLGGLKRLIDRSAPGSYTFAHTFPTGTHAMWLYYWLASVGIDPFNDVRTVVVPPPQMVMNMRIGNMSGFASASRGTPALLTTVSASPRPLPGYLARASGKGAGHPSRLGGTQPEHRPRAGGGPDGGAALDRRLAGEHPETARLLARRGWLNTKEQYLTGRMLGEYDNGLGRRWQDAHPMRFWAGGEVSFRGCRTGCGSSPSSAAGVAEAGSGLPRGGVAH